MAGVTSVLIRAAEPGPDDDAVVSLIREYMAWALDPVPR